MTVLYFGVAKDRVGIAEEVIAIEDELTLDELWDLLISHHPELQACRSMSRIALDGAYASDDQMVKKHAEVAIIPPVAGG